MHNLSLKKIFIGTAVSVVVSIILLCLLSILVCFGDFDDRTVSAFVLIVSAVSTFLGAFVLARNISGRGLVNGLVLGVIYCLLLMVISLLLDGAVSFEFKNLTRLFAIIAAAMLGGVLGINSAK